MRRKGSYWFGLLSPEEQQRFQNNVNDYVYDDNYYRNMTDFISCAFVWMCSPEGHHYWRDVASSYERTPFKVRRKLKKLTL